MAINICIALAFVSQPFFYGNKPYATQSSACLIFLHYLPVCFEFRSKAKLNTKANFQRGCRRSVFGGFQDYMALSKLAEISWLTLL